VGGIPLRLHIILKHKVGVENKIVDVLSRRMMILVAMSA